MKKCRRISQQGLYFLIDQSWLYANMLASHRRNPAGSMRNSLALANGLTRVRVHPGGHDFYVQAGVLATVEPATPELARPSVARADIRAIEKHVTRYVDVVITHPIYSLTSSWCGHGADIAAQRAERQNKTAYTPGLERSLFPSERWRYGCWGGEDGAVPMGRLARATAARPAAHRAVNLNSIQRASLLMWGMEMAVVLPGVQPGPAEQVRSGPTHQLRRSDWTSCRNSTE